MPPSITWGWRSTSSCLAVYRWAWESSAERSSGSGSWPGREHVIGRGPGLWVGAFGCRLLQRSKTSEGSSPGRHHAARKAASPQQSLLRVTTKHVRVLSTIASPAPCCYACHGQTLTMLLHASNFAQLYMLQEMYDRYFARVERNVHLSLASVVFAGDLDPAASDTIRISNRAVVLHNCTFALKPGQRLWIGSNAQLLLSEVHIVTAAANTQQQQQPGGAVTAGVPAGPGAASSGYGQARPQQQQQQLQRQSSGRLGGAAANGGGPVPVLETAALRLVRVSAHSGSNPGSPRRFTADESGFGSVLPSGSAIGGGPVSPLVHVAGGGRLVMRNCRVQVVAPQVEAAGQGAGPGGGALTGPVPPASPRTAAIAARAAAGTAGQTPGASLAAARGSNGGGGGDKPGRPLLTQVGR